MSLSGHAQALRLPAIVAGIALSLCAGDVPPLSAAEPEQIRIAGSDTMYPLLRTWATEFMQSHPGISISTRGGGSERGLDALIEGRVELATASRPLLPDEARRMMERHRSLGFAVLVARDALTVYLHLDNPVTNLSLDQLRGLFTGEIRNWAALGGDDRRVQPINRNSASGTRHFFAERVLGDAAYTRRATIAPTTGAILRAVAENPGAIGFGGLGALASAEAAQRQVDSLSRVKVSAIDGIEPTEDNVLDGSYPIARYLYLYAVRPPEGAVRDFIDWVLSAAGQEHVRASGYVSLLPRD